MTPGQYEVTASHPDYLPVSKLVKVKNPKHQEALIVNFMLPVAPEARKDDKYDEGDENEVVSVCDIGYNGLNARRLGIGNGPKSVRGRGH